MKEEVNQKQRAKEAWDILADIASNHSTITYGELGEQMQVHHRAIRFFLSLIQDYCLENNLPPLSILIINQTGKPGDGYIASKIDNFETDKERVHNFNWHEITNPFGNNDKNTSKYTGYWTFFCNPAKWEIDRFLKSGEEYDVYQVTPWQAKVFSAGQLGVIRVSVDKRTQKQLNGRPKLETGIYAIVEILSEPFKRIDKSDKYWIDREITEQENPIVKIRYIKNLIDKPITIDELKKEENVNLDKYLVNGFQASSMPLNKETFDFILGKVGNDDKIFSNIEKEDIPNTQTDLAKLEEKYRNATPEVKYILSKSIERGSISQKIKEYNNYKCQICEGLGLNPHSFKKTDGIYYIETHHIIPVSENKKGSLGLTNLITVCANHHRQLHYGHVNVTVFDDKFNIEIDGYNVEIQKVKLM